MSDIAHYFSPDRVCFLKAETRDEAIKELVEAGSAAIPEKGAFLEAVIARENVVSTGIGMGLAIPHARLASFEDFVIVVGIQRKGISWDALDGAPVKLIFLVGGPDDRQTDYLQLLSALTSSVKEEERRKQLLTLDDPESIVDLFRNW
jgi:nitrogen PTS system EIIA component